MYVCEYMVSYYTVKKGMLFSRLQPGCHLPNSPWSEIIKLIPARESLVNDIAAGDVKTANLFFTVYSLLYCAVVLNLHIPARKSYPYRYYNFVHHYL